MRSSEESLVGLKRDVVQNDSLFLWTSHDGQSPRLLRGTHVELAVELTQDADINQDAGLRRSRAQSLTAWNQSGLSIVRLSNRKRAKTSLVRTGRAMLLDA